VHIAAAAPTEGPCAHPAGLIAECIRSARVRFCGPRTVGPRVRFGTRGAKALFHARWACRNSRRSRGGGGGGGGGGSLPPGPLAAACARFRVPSHIRWSTQAGSRMGRPPYASIRSARCGLGSGGQVRSGQAGQSSVARFKPIDTSEVAQGPKLPCGSHGLRFWPGNIPDLT
jgi:hypothetical protein